MRTLRNALLLLGVGAGLGACAGAPKPVDVEPLAKSLPPELQAKFEVIEAKSKPSPAPSPVAPAHAAKKKKKAPTVALPTFTYPDRRPKVNPVWVGEQQVLEVTYIGLKAGEFILDVLPMKVVADRNVYHLRAQAISSSMLNLFYQLNDTVESFWDAEGLFSHRFHVVLDETKQKRDALELIDSEAKKDFYWNRRNHVEKGNTESKESFDLEWPFPQDSFSALYYLRSLPLEDGKTYTYPVISEGREWELVANVVRREELDTPLGRKRCIVVRPQTRYNGVLKQEKGESYIWLTDDDRRFVVRLEAEVKVGSIAARLTHVELGVPPNGQ